MIKRTFLIFTISFLSTVGLFGQTLDLDKFDIVFHDTLINKSDFLKNKNKIDSAELKYLRFEPITDGLKKIYYLNGQLYSQGEIKNKKENGFWTYWHENGQKAREGEFDEGKRTGTHKYWYPNGKLRGIGNFKNDKYEGKWTMYKEDGSETIEQLYKGRELVKEK